MFLKFQTPDCLHYNAVKSLSTPLFYQSIHYFPKVHLQCPPYHHQAETFTFFWQGHGQKRTAQNALKHAILSEKFNFFSEDGA